MIDRKRVREVFKEYTSRYDLENSMIWHKVMHTHRVADNCNEIAESLSMDKEEVDLAWLLGMLHDIGRFEQVTRYGTFVDSVSVDHAEFGADLLFKDRIIEDYVSDSLSESQLEILEVAIRFHNKLNLPTDLDDRTRCFCDIIRDADKADIFRVVCELPFEERIGTSKNLYQEGEAASDEVMKCVMEHRCIPRNVRQTRFDGHISHCSLAFELVYPRSRKIVAEQGYLSQLLAVSDKDGKPLWSEKECEQLGVVKKEIEAVFGETMDYKPKE